MHARSESNVGHLLAGEVKAYIKDDEVEEDKQDMDDDTHNELQLADHASCILQSIRQVLALLVDLHTNTFRGAAVSGGKHCICSS